MKNTQSKPKLTVQVENLELRQLLAADLVVEFDGLQTQADHLNQLAELAANFNPHALDLLHNHLELDGLGQTVVVIDSGVVYDHEALGGGFGTDYRVVGGWDFAEDDANPYDDGPTGYHGSHVAGIIGSSDVAYPGIAPAVDLVSLRIFDDQGISRVDWLEESLQWVHENRDHFDAPITTVNMSVAFSPIVAEQALQQVSDELETLKSDGIFVTVAAGNRYRPHSPDTISMLGQSEDIVAVGSVTKTGSLSSFSERNQDVLVAPGEHIVSTAPDYLFDFNGETDDFVKSSGTSMAAPYVAGAAVLVRQAMEMTGRQHVTPEHIYEHLHVTSDDVQDPVTGNAIKRVNIHRAVHSLLSNHVVSFEDVEQSAKEQAQFTDLGSVEFTKVPAGPGVQVFRATAARDGLFSVAAGGTSQIDLERVDGERLEYANQSSDQLDIVVAKGDQLWIRVQSHHAAEVTLGNLLSPGEGVSTLTATPHDDEIGIQFGRAIQLWANGLHYSLDEDSRIVLDGGLGDDQIEIGNRLSRAEVMSRDGVIEVSKSGTHIQITNAEDVKVRGKTNATLFGTNRREDLTVQGSRAAWHFGSTLLQLMDFGHLEVNAYSGRDLFSIAGISKSQEVIVGEAGFSWSAGGQSISAFDFEQIDLDSQQSRGDTLIVNGSSSAEQIYVGPELYSLRNRSKNISALGFEVTNTYGNGGYDRVRMFDSPGADTFFANPDSALLQGRGFRNSIFDIHSVFAYSRQGADKAELTASAGNDIAQLSPISSRLRGHGYSHLASQFDTVIVDAGQGGTDTVFMSDSKGNDDFFATSEFARMSGSTFYNLAKGFAKVQATSRFGMDRASLFDSAGDDLFSNDEWKAVLSGDDFWNEVVGFDIVSARSTRGIDHAEVFGLATDDSIQSKGRSMIIDRAHTTTTTAGFDSANIVVDASEQPQVDLQFASFVFEIGTA